MTQQERYKITSNDYADLLIQYDRNDPLLEQFKNDTIHIINSRFAVAYVEYTKLLGRSLSQYGYSSIPSCYGLESESSLNASGVNRIRTLPSFQLKGKGVLIGIVDTGIDYTNPVFLNKNGTSKIVSIWDQSMESEDRYPGGAININGLFVGDPTFYGTEYTMEDINQALQSNNPYEIVPSKDEVGHGTMLAGIAAGAEMTSKGFSGVASDSELVVVKLKQAKTILRNYFSIPLNVPCYQENDIIWGVQYLTRVARRLNKPIAICIGIGSSQGNHDGRGALASHLSILGDYPGISITVSGGNEGLLKRHYFSQIDPSIGYQNVRLNVGMNEKGFSMEVWGSAPGPYNISIISPSGELIPVIENSLFFNRELSFLFEGTIVIIDYQTLESESGAHLILLRFRNPAPGIWQFNVYGNGDLPGSFHMWLPSGNFISNDTYFLEADPYTTITSPGNSIIPITVTAYDSNNNSLYNNSGRGFSSINTVKPELVAPGVSILGPTLDHDFTDVTGTSAAAAHTTGVTALLLEWGILKGNFKGMTTVEVKKFLIRGAIRSSTLTYPNQDWGYGKLNIYNSFLILKSDN